MMSQEVDEAIRKTVTAVETVAPKAWDLTVRFQRVDAAVGLAQGAAVAVALLAMFGFVWSIIGKLLADEYDKKERVGYRCLASVILVILLFVDTINAANNLAQYVAPDLYAAKALMEKVTP